MKGKPGFLGVFSKDSLPKNKFNKCESLIINLEDFFTGEGTHSVALFRPKTGPCEYFDSYGLPLPKEVIKYCKKLKVIYNSIQVQMKDSDLCGYSSVYFIISRLRGRTPVEILFDFTTKPSYINSFIWQNPYLKKIDK